jgi:metal-responsive CopG/Arc/MetJ family transcriptional regulator
MQNQSHTIKVTGVPEELVRLLDNRIKERHTAGRSEYIRELIRKDVLDEPRTLRGILSSIHTGTRDMKDTEEGLDTFFDEVRTEAYQGKEVNKNE